MARNKEKRAKQDNTSQEFIYEGKARLTTFKDLQPFVRGLQYFAFGVLFACLAALVYWYYCYAPQEPDLFNVVDIDGKGKGLIAGRDIKVRFYQGYRHGQKYNRNSKENWC
jgi:hypothetical protein